ncbi:MAG: Re/Si-specific NAD(P)(+) transhydrogenase subunit alpha, partial [Planctomycetaceae bacterium]|nr:Re/Si-specific NAD(P)(+) transhydrogenase subunit alpha [Planctomycetaceae bacterium]
MVGESVETPTVGVVRETFPGERRVALVPASAAKLVKAGLKVLVEQGAGEEAGFPDSDWQNSGVRLVADRKTVFEQADILLKVRGGGADSEALPADLELFRPHQVLIGACDPLSSPEAVAQLAERQVTSFALELLPRITRAQSMDILSSMATVAGYRAVLLAATHLPRMFPMLMTAAGTVAPAKVLIVGAGVAGLQAIATAKRLGAVVQAYDVRPAVKEQVESLGGRFVELELETAQSEQSGGYAKEMDEDFYRRQREMMGRVVAECDVVITTAAIPGKKSPVLVTAEMVQGMAAGSVIVDLAAERGGNCELTVAGETVVREGVTILGPLNLAAEIPFHASEMYSRNITTFLLHLLEDGRLSL